MANSTPKIKWSDYLTPTEVAKRYKNLITASTLANWRAKGEGPNYVKVGGRVLYSLSAIEDWEKKRTIKVSPR